MIFAVTLDKVLSGEKTQTRRVVKDNEEFREFGLPGELGKPAICIKRPAASPFHWNHTTKLIKKYQVGKTYAVQPGRGEKAVGRIRITAIRLENLQDITEQDAKAEGVIPYTVEGDYPPPDNMFNVTYRWAFEDVWQSLNYPPGSRWEDNPEVWVIEFELVEAA